MIYTFQRLTITFRGYSAVDQGGSWTPPSWRNREEFMKQAVEYRQHAAECRKLALGAKSEEERHQLLHMAQAWEQLAEHRDRVVAPESTKNANQDKLEL